MATVRLYFNDGTNQYTFPLVYHVADPKEGMKATIIKGTRGDGAIIIPGGKRPQEIRIRGKIVEEDGYETITSKMNEMRQKVTTNTATLKMQHYTGGSWVDDWSYTVRRIEEIVFPQSLRTDSQEYELEFLVIAY
jgi:hypothetical protein